MTQKRQLVGRLRPRFDAPFIEAAWYKITDKFPPRSDRRAYHRAAKRFNATAIKNGLHGARREYYWDLATVILSEDPLITYHADNYVPPPKDCGDPGWSCVVKRIINLLSALNYWAARLPGLPSNDDLWAMLTIAGLSKTWNDFGRDTYPIIRQIVFNEFPTPEDRRSQFHVVVNNPAKPRRTLIK